MNCRITRTKSGKDYPKIAPGWGIIGRKKWEILKGTKYMKNGKYPARKSIQTNFAHVGGPDGLQFQADAIAYCGK